LDLVAGFLIPKGWKVMPLFRNIHHSPDNFKDPQMFDASRFKVMQVLLPLFPLLLFHEKVLLACSTPTND
jgi:cytochrome P450